MIAPQNSPLPTWTLELDAGDDVTGYLTENSSGTFENAGFTAVKNQLLQVQTPATYPEYSRVEKGTFETPYDKVPVATGRVLACLCDRGRAISLTARSLKPELQIPKLRLVDGSGWNERLSEYLPSTKRKINWFTIDEHVTALAGCLFPGYAANPRQFTPVHGLLVVTGSTKSAKSIIARGLIYRYLESYVKRSPEPRRPHLVTFEDPIEQFFDGEDDNSKCHSEKARNLFGIDYTPREKGKDVHDLAGLFRDALRQTPAVVFVGEVREEADWKEVLEFAGTGHLVVTTAHAGSLLETMIKLFAAVKAKTPADRRRFAERIFGVVHMRSAGLVEKRTLLLPALWRRSEAGLSNLVAVGLGAIVPDLPGESTVLPGSADKLLVPSHTSVVSRRWFAQQLTAMAETNLLAEISKSGAARTVSRSINSGMTLDATKAGQNPTTKPCAEDNRRRVLEETSTALRESKSAVERKAIRFDLEGI